MRNTDGVPFKGRRSIGFVERAEYSLGRRFDHDAMALSLKQRRYVEAVLAGLPHLAEAVAAIPPDWQPEAFQAAERSFLKAFRQLEFPGPQTWASSVMRRLRRRVPEAEKEKLTKLYEQLSANEHRSGPLMRQTYRFRCTSNSFIRRSKERGTHSLSRKARERQNGTRC